MTAAAVTFFRPEFDDFLYAPVGADASGMTLSVLSALSRLDLDPWEEAAELSELPADTAAQRLTSLIARLPGGRWTSADVGAIAARLIELLPSPRSTEARLVAKARLRGTSGSAVMLICVALVLAGVVVAARWERPPVDGAAPSPPQTSVPNSR
jgi:hypothetical protein